MNRLLTFVFSPSGLVIALLGGSIWIWRRDSRPARRFLLGAAVAYALASIYVVPFGVNRVLTSAFRPLTAADVGPGQTAIVLLGGGDTAVIGRNGQVSVMTPIEAARVLEAARVFRLIAPEWIISSGGASDDGGKPSSTMMKDELVRLGVPESRILLESTSRDTHDEVLLVLSMIRKLGVTQIILVTSDTHMLRSLGAFRAQGAVCLAATAPAPWLVMSSSDWLLPSDRGLELSLEVMHEIIGIPYYWARGWWRP
jgi:uncharacterized SAM-binding protein YcdF (DUF218 family)